MPLNCLFSWLKLKAFTKPFLSLTVMPFSCDPQVPGTTIQVKDICKAWGLGLPSPQTCCQPLPGVFTLSLPWRHPSCTYSWFGGLACAHLRGVTHGGARRSILYLAPVLVYGSSLHLTLLPMARLPARCLARCGVMELGSLRTRSTVSALFAG